MNDLVWKLWVVITLVWVVTTGMTFGVGDVSRGWDQLYTACLSGYIARLLYKEAKRDAKT